MNAGNRLARWFAAQFGSTQCRAISGCDFSSAADVDGYLARGGVGRRRTIANRVANRVSEIVAADAAGAALILETGSRAFA